MEKYVMTLQLLVWRMNFGCKVVTKRNFYQGWGTNEPLSRCSV